MSAWLDSTACSVVLYALAGSSTVATGFAERHRQSQADPQFWPAFWFAAGGLLLAIAAGRASSIGGLLTDIGREQTRSGGWYEVRRSLQALVIVAMAAASAAIAAVAMWRMPQRRKRCLPTALLVLALVCFAGVRLVSLHQVDALLRNRRIQDVTIGAAVEIVLLLSVAIASAWQFPRTNRGRSDEHPDHHIAPNTPASIGADGPRRQRRGPTSSPQSEI